MSKGVKVLKMPADLHARLVSLNEKVVERFGPPPNYRRGGPGAALHAGTALLEEVMNGKQCIVPADQMAEYEAAYQARHNAPILSTMLLAVAMRTARAEGADDLDAGASAIVAETIRTFVQLEVLEPEAEAEPADAATLRQIAQFFLDDAERLSTRARAAVDREVAQ